MINHAFEQGRVIPITMPDGYSDDPVQYHAEDEALELLRTLTDWIWTGGVANGKRTTHRNRRNGIVIRSIIVCWLLNQDNHQHSLAKTAREWGMAKQSFGFWLRQLRAHPVLGQCIGGNTNRNRSS